LTVWIGNIEFCGTIVPDIEIQQNLSINHLVRFPAGYQPQGPATFPTVLALHGHGSNENDLISLAH